MMKNMDQLRAGHAAKYMDDKIRGVADGEVVKKVPTLIRENGLLSTMAFACERKKEGWKNEGHQKVFEILLDYFKSRKDMGVEGNAGENVENYLKWLAGQPSETLRAHTAEAMAYLNYLRRFARGKNNE